MDRAPESTYRTDDAAGTRPTSVLRYDAPSILREPKRTVEGFLYADAFVARAPIVMEYPQTDGTIVRELVLPEDLHDPESLKTLAGKPVTDDHPPEEVTAQNATVHMRGAVQVGSAVADDGLVRVPIVIHDAALIAKVDAGKVETSPGYRVDIVHEPGVHPTEGPYDVRQTNRRYNHFAVVDAARGGSTVRLRADGNAEIIADDVRHDGAPTMTRAELIAALTDLSKCTRADAASALDALAGLRADDTLGDVLKRLGDGEATIAALTKERDALQKTVDGFEEFQKKSEEPEEIEKKKGDALKLVDEIVALRVKCDEHGVEYDGAKHDAADLRALIVDKIVDVADLPAERTDAFDRAVVATLGMRTATKPGPWSGLNFDGKQPAKTKTEGERGVVHVDGADGESTKIDLLSIDTRPRI